MRMELARKFTGGVPTKIHTKATCMLQATCSYGLNSLGTSDCMRVKA